MAKNASAQEVIAARAFLKFLGRDWRNAQLIIAVIAWARISSGRLSGSLGNNPFRLYKKGANYVPYGYGGTRAASFGSLTDAFIAAAKSITYLAKLYPKNVAGGPNPVQFKAGGAFVKTYTYKELLLSFKSGSMSEVLTAISLSNFSKSHYGLRVDEKGKVTRHPLMTFAATYDGIITPEAEAAARAEREKQAAEQRAWEAQERARKAALAKWKRRPKQLNPPAPSREYLDPYAVGRLYREKHDPFKLPE